MMNACDHTFDPPSLLGTSSTLTLWLSLMFSVWLALLWLVLLVKEKSSWFFNFSVFSKANFFCTSPDPLLSLLCRGTSSFLNCNNLDACKVVIPLLGGVSYFMGGIYLGCRFIISGLFYPVGADLLEGKSGLKSEMESFPKHSSIGSYLRMG